MNNRVLEIVQNPDLLILNDIEILEKEISQNPFVQSFRALQLLATHRFQENNYSAKLSQTAAFTTDKKILYQLIHQNESGKLENIEENSISEIPPILEENTSLSKVEKPIAAPENKFQEIEIAPDDLPKKVYINGELNRILFEGEENFLNEEQKSIDLEATQESGEIVLISKIENTEEFINKTRDFTPETIINEEKIKSEEEIIESGAELSFHGETKFLSEIKIEVKKESLPHFVRENKTSKHEIEMQKLIAEVESKMKKSSLKTIQKDDDFLDNTTLDFTGISHEEPSENNEKSKEIPEDEVEREEEVSTWKPMDFTAQKSTFRNIEKFESKAAEILIENKTQEQVIKIEEEQTEISTPKEQKIEEKAAQNIEVEIKEETPCNAEESNVPVFINTWQNWLKLNPEKTVPLKNTKEKAIETFIEKEPKISKLKEESSFVVKDKGDNISHLMTETLANLYLDQKLYAKAQKAFELLMEKEPEKAEKFKEKLLKINDLRNRK